MPKATCSVSDCEKPRFSRGWCTMHYQRWRKYGSPEVNLRPVASGDGTCRHCSEPAPRRSDRGFPPLYCSKSCQTRASYRRRAEALNEANRQRTREIRATSERACRGCGERFAPKKSLAKQFCSTACSNNYYRDRTEATCAESDCDRPVRARGLCHMHYRAARRASGEEQAQEWTPERKARWLARAALKRGAGEAGKFTADEIYDRDGWVCGICDDAVEHDLTWPDPMSPSIDHIIPLAKGGDHLPENVQLAHLRCNISKGARVA